MTSRSSLHSAMTRFNCTDIWYYSSTKIYCQLANNQLWSPWSTVTCYIESHVTLNFVHCANLALLLLNLFFVLFFLWASSFLFIRMLLFYFRLRFPYCCCFVNRICINLFLHIFMSVNQHRFIYTDTDSALYFHGRCTVCLLHL